MAEQNMRQGNRYLTGGEQNVRPGHNYFGGNSPADPAIPYAPYPPQHQDELRLTAILNRVERKLDLLLEKLAAPKDDR